MTALVLYLLTGCAASIQILSQIVWFVWGRRISPLEVAALVGAILVTVAACFAISRPRRASALALVGCLPLALYYGIGVVTGLANILHLGSQYGFKPFVPPLLVLITAVHAVRVFRSSSLATAQPQRWIIAVVCLGTVAISPLVGFSRTAPFNFSLPRRVVTVEMSWKRGDAHYGPNFISLQSSCPNSSDARCFCGTDFKIMNSAAFADYIQSSGARPMAVRYEVFYDPNGEAISANLVSIGVWPRSKFHENEGNISSGGAITPGERGLTTHTPQDCFARLSRH
jgi:hypothetical protein